MNQNLNFRDAFLDTQEGIEALLASAYANGQLNGWGGAADYIALNECTTDVFEDYIGSYYNNTLRKYQDFSFDPGHGLLLSRIIGVKTIGL